MDFTKLKQGTRCADCGLDISKATDKSNESDVKTADDGYSVFLLFARIIEVSSSSGSSVIYSSKRPPMTGVDNGQF